MFLKIEYLPPFVTSRIAGAGVCGWYRCNDLLAHEQTRTHTRTHTFTHKHTHTHVYAYTMPWNQLWNNHAFLIQTTNHTRNAGAGVRGWYRCNDQQTHECAHSLPLHGHCAEPSGYTNLTFLSVCVCLMCVYVLRVFVCEFYVCYSLPLHRHCAEPGGCTNLTFLSVCVCVCVACVCV